MIFAELTRLKQALKCSSCADGLLTADCQLDLASPVKVQDHVSQINASGAQSGSKPTQRGSVRLVKFRAQDLRLRRSNKFARLP